MENSEKVARELRAAVQKMNQSLRAFGSGRPDPHSAADCFNRIIVAITDIDQRLVVLEQRLNSDQTADNTDLNQQ